MDRRHFLRAMFGTSAAAIVLPSEVFPFRKIFLPASRPELYHIVYTVTTPYRIGESYNGFMVPREFIDQVAQVFQVPPHLLAYGRSATELLREDARNFERLLVAAPRTLPGHSLAIVDRELLDRIEMNPLKLKFRG